MKSRLPILLLLMVGLVLLRWWAPPGGSDAESSPPVVPALERPQPSSAAVALADAASTPSAADRSGAVDVPGNAFAVRTERPIVPMQEPVPVVAVASMPVAPVVVEPPPPSPPPLQVIGTWNDAQGRGVFVVAGASTVLARPGTVLLSDYRVTAIDRTTLSVLQTSNQRQWQLPIAQAPSSP